MKRRYQGGGYIPEGLPDSYRPAPSRSKCNSCAHNRSQKCIAWGGSQIDPNYLCDKYQDKNLVSKTSAGNRDSLNTVKSNQDEDVQLLRGGARKARARSNQNRGGSRTLY